MRKITLFSSLLCALLFSTSAMAQVTELLNKGVVSIGATPVTVLTEGTWYVMENQGNYAYDNGTGLWSAPKAGLMTVGSPTSTCAKVLFRVSDGQTPVSVTEDEKTGNVTAYKIQWGTGRYTKWPKNASSEIVFNQQIVTTSNVDEADFVYVAPVVDGNGYVRFAQNTNIEYGGSKGQAVAENKNTLFDKNSGGMISNWSDNSKLVAPGSNLSGENAAWKIYEVTLADMVSVAVSAQKDGAPTYTANVQLPVGTGINVVECLAANGLLEYDPSTTTVDIEQGTTAVTIKYTNAIPFASSYEGLGGDEAGNKWVSMMTYNGRMYLYDADSETNNGKYPCIDRVTFTNLKDKKFWGFICENPLTETVKIVNKGAGESKGYLYYTRANSSNETPLLFATEAEASSKNWTNNEWIIEKGKVKDGDQYYGIKSKNVDQYINNMAGKGYMVTLNQNTSADNGSNIKFTSELETYNIMKERALKAPSNAVHSLNDDARYLINTEGGSTITSYKAVIQKIITDDDPNAGFVTFDETGSKYYVLRNYTPDGEDTYLLSSEDGSVASAFQVPSTEVGSAENVMKVSNINTIWKIAGNPNAPQPENVGSSDIGVSKTIGRFVTHVNSQKYLTDGSSITADGNSGNTNNNNVITTYPLGETGMNWYFVNLGAGQHFMKTKQYNGSGQQAPSMPLSLVQSGGKYVLQRKRADAHFKNTRDAWYGIEVSSIEVKIGESGYATIYLPFGVTLPTKELTAYAVTSASNSEATLVGGNCIPANQGAILKGNPGVYTLNIDDDASWDITNNLLKGSCMAENVSDDAYVLSQPTGKPIGLYRADKNQDSGNAWLNNSNKAYLPATAVTGAEDGARFLSFNFDTVTGLDVISGTESGSEESVVYDLSGRRVRNAQKGLYIVNGKKVIK